MFRLLSVVCAVVACGLVGWAGHLARHPLPDADPPGEPDVHTGSHNEPPGLVVDDAEQDLGAVPVGEHPVSFHITNRTDRLGEVVGGSSGCNSVCCFDARAAGRVQIPPGERVEVVGALGVNQAGPFEFEGRFYLNDRDRLRTVRVKITGVGVPLKGKPDAPPR